MNKDLSRPPHWDVTNVYSSLDSAEFKADFELMNTSTDALFAFLDEYQIKKQATSPIETTPKKLAQISGSSCKRNQ